MIAVPLLASVLGSKESTGIMTTMFLLGDILAVKAYAKSGNWQDIKKLLPAVVVGIIIGGLVGNLIDDHQLKILIAILIFVCLFFMIYQEVKKTAIKVPQFWWSFALIGSLCGFASMIGNAAGPIFAVYLLAVNLDKKHYLGTTAWFFLIYQCN